MKKSPKILLSGGGTGGHIYPAIAIANELKTRLPQAEFLFVGALGKMEMQKVPKAGYDIVGLSISGFNRSNILSNIGLPFKVIKSLSAAARIIKDFQPDLAIGTGGYASGPTLWQAARKRVPIFLQEQNAFPGYTNKMLANKAKAIFTAYPEIPSFPKNIIHLTGNPVRAEVFDNLPDQKTAKTHFGLNPELPVIFSMGGSQGARAINNGWQAAIDQFKQQPIQLLWQVGKWDFDKINGTKTPENIVVKEFIYEMQMAYAAADIIVSRAGAGAISELALVAKPSILVPLPTAAEDHQTKNAMALVNKKAALLLENSATEEALFGLASDLTQDKELQKTLAQNIKAFAKPNATVDIVDKILETINA